MEAGRIGTMGFARILLPASTRGTTRRHTSWRRARARPKASRSVRAKAPHRAMAPRVWFRGSNAARAARWHGELSSRLEPSGGCSRSDTRRPTWVRDLPREAPPARKARGVGSPKSGARATEYSGRASVPGPRRLATANSSAKISSGPGQRELHRFPSSPHRPRDARSTTPPAPWREARAWREKP